MSNETSTGTVYTITVKGTAGERVEVVRPLQVRGDKTLVAFVRGARIATKWVSTARIETRQR
jgi:hypothetical protein